MYQVANSQLLLRGHRGLRSRRRLGPRVSSTVLFLGLTSLFTDISSEMVATILPLYLVYTVGLTPLQFGFVDGLHQGAAALVRIAGGFIADRTRRHKEVAGVGYGLSAFCKLGFLAAGNAWTALSGVVLVDRTGKGIRTAPRDALISLSTPPGQLGTAFGVHRALDTMGAMLGPLVAFGLLALTPLAFDAVFVVSFCFALIGLGILVTFVENQPIQPRRAAREGSSDGAVSLRAAVGLLGSRPFRVLVLIGGALGLMTLSDGFLYLGLQRRLDFEPNLLPLLYVGSALVYMVLAVPMGRLADRVGRAKVFFGGYGLLLLLYASLLLPAIAPAGVVVCVLLVGTYYAATEGVLMALASAVLPPELRASGLAVLVTATTLSRLLASVLFGAVWTWVGIETAVLVFAVGLVVAMAFSGLALARAKEAVARA